MNKSNNSDGFNSSNMTKQGNNDNIDNREGKKNINKKMTIIILTTGCMKIIPLNAQHKHQQKIMILTTATKIAKGSPSFEASSAVKSCEAKANTRMTLTWRSWLERKTLIIN